MTNQTLKWFKILNGHTLSYLSDLLKPYIQSCVFFQNTGLLSFPRVKKKSAGCRAFSYRAPFLWNNFPADITQSDSVEAFKSKLKTHLFCHNFQLVAYSLITSDVVPAVPLCFQRVGLNESILCLVFTVHVCPANKKLWKLLHLSNPLFVCCPTSTWVSKLCAHLSLVLLSLCWTIGRPGTSLSLPWLSMPHSGSFGSGSSSSRSFCLSSCLSVCMLSVCLSLPLCAVCLLFSPVWVCVSGVLELCLLCVCAVCPLSRSL